MGEGEFVAAANEGRRMVENGCGRVAETMGIDLVNETLRLCLGVSTDIQQIALGPIPNQFCFGNRLRYQFCCLVANVTASWNPTKEAILISCLDVMLMNRPIHIRPSANAPWLDPSASFLATSIYFLSLCDIPTLVWLSAASHSAPGALGNLQEYHSITCAPVKPPPPDNESAPIHTSSSPLGRPTTAPVAPPLIHLPPPRHRPLPLE